MNSDGGNRESKGVTRRAFLTTMGIGAAVTAGVSQLEAAEPANQVLPADQFSPITLNINGRQHKVLVEPRWTLLFVIREKLGLTSAKAGCERGECGGCTVLIDGFPRYSCLTLAVEAEGSEIATLEGLMIGEELGPVQQAFLENDAFQCGYCTPGQMMSVEGLLRQKPDPTFEEIRKGVSGNLCRCGAYNHIFKAAKRAAELKKGSDNAKDGR